MKADTEIDLETCLRPTYFLNSDDPRILETARKHRADSQRERAVLLYYYVRDGWKYNPYTVSRKRENCRASFMLTQKSGYCTTKALLLAALARAAGIPSRLGFGDVRNHLSSPRLIEYLRSEVFAWHGFTELYLDGRWVRCTPAFDAALCAKFSVSPLEFDGRSDSLFQEFDAGGRKFMEYIRYRGIYDDLPFEEMFQSLAEIYPHLFEENKL